MGGKQKHAFLFINKDSSSDSLSRSRACEKTRILSHVQINRRRLDKRKNANHERARWEGPNITVNTSSEDDDPIPFSSPPPTSTSTPTSIARQSPTNPSRPPQNLSLALTFSPVPTANSTDPFSSTTLGVALTPSLHYILQSGLQHLAKKPFLATAFAPSASIARRRTMRHDAMISERLRRCVSDRLLMYASLAYCASSLTWLGGWPAICADVFVDRALPAVRERLQGLGTPNGDPTWHGAPASPDAWLLLSIYSLALIELWHGAPNMFPRLRSVPGRRDGDRLAACRTHLRAVVEMVGCAGSGVREQPYVFESIILGDKYLAIVERARPMLDVEGWDPGPTPPKGPGEYMAVDRVALGIGGGFFSSPVSSVALLGVVQDIVEYIRIAVWAWEREGMTRRKETWLFLRYHALVYRLLNLDSLRGVEEFTRLAVLLFFVGIVAYAGADVAATTVAGQLKAALEEDCSWQKVHGASHARLMFWILSTGAMITRAGDDRNWFRGRVLYATHDAGIKLSSQSFKETIESYLFLEDRQTRAFEEFVASTIGSSDHLSDFTAMSSLR